MGYRLPVYPSRNKPLPSLVSYNTLFVCVSINMSLLTVFHESQLFVSLVVSLNRLWTPRAKHSALFTLAAPTEAIAVPFMWWTEGGANQCLFKWGKCGWWPKCLFFLQRSQWNAYPDLWGPLSPSLLDPPSALHQLLLLSPITALS